MPLLEIVQTRRVTASIRFDEATATQIDQYAAFVNAPADEVVEKAVSYVFAKDRDFQEYLRTPAAKDAPARLRIRSVPEKNGTGESTNGAPKSQKAIEVSNDSRPRS